MKRLEATCKACGRTYYADSPDRNHDFCIDKDGSVAAFGDGCEERHPRPPTVAMVDYLQLKAEIERKDQEIARLKSELTSKLF